MGIKELALAAAISSSVLVACQPAKPPELAPPPTIPPAADSDNKIDFDKLKTPPVSPTTEIPIAIPEPSSKSTGSPPDSTPTTTIIPESKPPVPKLPPTPEASATKEAEQPIVIWFLGSSTMKNFELIADYIQKLFPGPKFRFSIGGRPGAQIEDLTAEINKNTLVPIVDKQPILPEKINFIVIYGGANDLFLGESVTGMEIETINLFATLSEKYPNASFIYLKPYHLTGQFLDKNPSIDEYNRYLSPTKIISEVKKRTGRTISIATVDINEDLDKCDPKIIQCFLDDRHAGPPILRDMIDKTKDLINPPLPAKPKPASFLYPGSILWSYNEQRQRKVQGSRRLSNNSI